MGQELYIKIELKAEMFLLRPLDVFVRSLINQLPAFSGNETQQTTWNWLSTKLIRISAVMYKSAEKGPVKIEIFVKDDMLEIRLEDHGEKFNPSEVMEPDFQNLGESGLGIWLMKQFMDDLVYESGECGSNVLRLVKRIPAENIFFPCGCLE